MTDIHSTPADDVIDGTRTTMTEVDDGPFVRDEHQEALKKFEQLWSNLDIDHKIAVNQADLAKFGLVLNDHHPIRDFFLSKVGHRLWLFPSIVDDHSHCLHDEHMRTTQNYYAGYTPAKRYQQRGYVAECNICRKKEVFDRVRRIWTCILAALFLLAFWVVAAIFSPGVAHVSGIILMIFSYSCIALAVIIAITAAIWSIVDTIV